MPTRYSNPGPQYFNGSAPLSGGKLYFYVNDGGSLTPKDTYSDASLTTANSNPVILSASGVVPDIFLDGAYRVILQDKNGVQLDDWLDVGLVGTEGEFSAWSATVIYAQYEIVRYTDGHYYKSLQNANQNKNPSTQTAWWARIDFVNFWNTNVTYGAGEVAVGSNGLLYTAVISTVGDDPTVDNGTNWQLFATSNSTQTFTNKTIRWGTSVVAVNTQAVASRLYVLTASCTLTLPITPTAGDWVSFNNRSGTETAVIARNGSNIMSLAEDMTLNSVNAYGILQYADATRGWVLL